MFKMMALRIRNNSCCPALALMYIDGTSSLESMHHGYVDLAKEFLSQLLLYRDKDFPDSVNRYILGLTLNSIHKTGGFDTPPFHKPPNRNVVFVNIVFNFNFSVFVLDIVLVLKSNL